MSPEYYRRYFAERKNDEEFRRKRREYKRKWREQNRERYRAKNREYCRKDYKRNRERRLAQSAEYRNRPEAKSRAKKYGAEYYRKNKEVILAQTGDYYRKHKDQLYVKQLIWIKNNKDKCRGYARRVYRNNIEHYREKGRKQARKHKDKRSAYQQRPEVKARRRECRDVLKPLINARARERYRTDPARREYVRSLSKNSPKRLAVREKWHLCKGLCYICGLYVVLEEIVADHVTPKSRGGSNEIFNLMPVHDLCNRVKRARLNHPIARIDLFIACLDVKVRVKNG